MALIIKGMSPSRTLTHSWSFLAVCFSLLFGEVVAQTPTSEFTTTDPSKVKILEDSLREKEPEIDHFKHLCPGLGGYHLIHEGGDLRSWINLEFGGRVTDLMSDTLSACRGQFPAKANHVVQWRGYRRGDTFVPYAHLVVAYHRRSNDGFRLSS